MLGLAHRAGMNTSIHMQVHVCMRLRGLQSMAHCTYFIYGTGSTCQAYKSAKIDFSYLSYPICVLVPGLQTIKRKN